MSFVGRFLNYGALGSTIAREMMLAFNENGFIYLHSVPIHVFISENKQIPCQCSKNTYWHGRHADII